MQSMDSIKIVQIMFKCCDCGAVSCYLVYCDIDR